LFELISNEHQKGKISGDEFSLLFNLSQTNYYDFLLGHIEQYQPNFSKPRVGIAMSEDITTKLSPFIKTASVSVSASQALKPPAFGRLIAMRGTGNREVDRVEHDKKGGRVTSSLLALRPFYVEYSNYWEVFNETGVNVDYYPGQPDDAKWNYITTSGREVYTSTGSIDPLWRSTEVYAILARMLKAWGVSVDDGMVFNYANQLIKEGE
jgi:hypothetical protein